MRISDWSSDVCSSDLQEAKAPAQRFVERFARWYTPAVVLLSAASFAVTSDVRLALTLLVIGCPGALVISMPVAMVAGIGRAARDGILVKGGEHLEQVGRVTAVAFDKRSEEHTSELQALMRNSYAVFCLKKKQ